MIKQRRIQAAGVNLNVVEEGPADGPLVILLHGFPEFWFEWRDLIGPLAHAGFRVVAPDQRGYGLSDKPRGVDAYRLDSLADDVIAIAAAIGHKDFRLVGHDWGGSVAWWVAARNPERVLQMAILNAAHPAIWRDAMASDPEQRRRSGYVKLVRLRWLPEAIIRVGGFRSLEASFEDSVRREAFAPAAMSHYRKAWQRPGALTAMLNWYRALFRQPLSVPAPNSLTVPTLLIWGDRDRFAVPDLADRSAALVREVRVEHWTDATHWTPHDAPERILQTLIEFFARTSAS